MIGLLSPRTGSVSLIVIVVMITFFKNNNNIFFIKKNIYFISCINLIIIL